MILFALEYLLFVKFSAIFALRLVELDADPIALSLALDLSDELDVSLLSFVFERNELHAIANGKLGNL